MKVDWRSVHINKYNFIQKDWAALLWALMPSNVVTVAWPQGWTETDHLGNQFLSSDPNDHWRPWLEKNVGRQYWSWDWRISTDCQNVEIQFRKKQDMLHFTMRWC